MVLKLLWLSEKAGLVCAACVYYTWWVCLCASQAPSWWSTAQTGIWYMCAVCDRCVCEWAVLRLVVLTTQTGIWYTCVCCVWQMCLWVSSTQAGGFNYTDWHMIHVCCVWQMCLRVSGTQDASQAPSWWSTTRGWCVRPLRSGASASLDTLLSLSGAKVSQSMCTSSSLMCWWYVCVCVCMHAYVRTLMRVCVCLCVCINCVCVSPFLCVLVSLLVTLWSVW